MERDDKPSGSDQEIEIELFQEPELESEEEIEEGGEKSDIELSSDSPLDSPSAISKVLGIKPDSESEEIEEPATAKASLRVIVVSGAKGGVGKTILAANLGLYLATIGRKVILVDADAGGTNLHTCLGTHPAPLLQRLKRSSSGDAGGETKLPEGTMIETPIAGLRLMGTGLDVPVSSASRVDRLQKLIPLIRCIDADYAVIDLGGGVVKEVLDVYLSADLTVYVTVPEPTAIENTYRFLRGAFSRFLISKLSENEAMSDLERRLRSYDGIPSPLDFLKSLEEEEHPAAHLVKQALSEFEPRLVINQTRLRADLELGYAMRSATRRRLGITIDYLGHIDHDDTVWTCVRNRRPLLLESPGTKSSKKIEKIARRLLMIDAGKYSQSNRPTVPVDTHHDLLEVERGATEEEIRRAYKRCRDTYAPHSQCCYGLFELHELEKLRMKLDEAFDVLLDPTRRRPYELSVFTSSDSDTTFSEPKEDAEIDTPPAPPEIKPETHFSGALLKQVRLSQRVRLREISQRTKIGINYLKAIESEDFKMLPALVYTRGFVGEFAKFLKLDAQQVSHTYVKRFQEYLEKKNFDKE